MIRHLTGLSSLLVFLAIPYPRVEAHPAHAKPVKYPYVVGFERFHSSLDDDEYLARGGLILLNELNCVSCHEPPAEWKGTLSGVVGTRLEGVAGRLSPVDLELMIRNPRFVKQDTIMPSLFSGRDRKLEEVEALRQFLSSLTQEIPSYPVGDIEAGRHLYHRVGCAACHAPEVGYRPPGIPENAEIEMAGLPSVPMNLADLYDLNALTHFLLFPNQHRPSGRMPDFRLSEKEAVDLAAYLKAGPDLVLPENVSEALGAVERQGIDPVLVEKGKSLFVQKNCHACHDLSSRGIPPASPMATPLARLSTTEDFGCLAERPPGGPVPFYGLDPVQKRSIRAALERLATLGDWDRARQIDWRMKKLNCYACHERDGVGGAETAREVYFGFGSEAAIALGRFGHLPPALDFVGARLTASALADAILDPGGSAVRPYLAARMPGYREREGKPLVELLREHDQVPEFSPAEPGEAGKRLRDGGTLFSAEGRNCAACHVAGGEQTPSFPGIDLTATADRIRKDYFDFFLRRKYSPHPPRVEGLERPEEGLSRTETGALWDWLRDLED